MKSFNADTNFFNLLSSDAARILLERLTELEDNIELKSNVTKDYTISSKLEKKQQLEQWKNEWQRLSNIKADDNARQSDDDSEQAATDWLIQLFDNLFANQQVTLARSDGEPEYFPAQNDIPARIEFAHGFFASALHEISHWCIAGEERRGLSDFGYWYAPDGRTAAQQQAFERVEIKPQALECLFTLACGRPFQVSQDNLFADFDTNGSTFASDVYHQVVKYTAEPSTLPRDAKTLLHAFLSICIESPE